MSECCNNENQVEQLEGEFGDQFENSNRRDPAIYDVVYRNFNGKHVTVAVEAHDQYVKDGIIQFVVHDNGPKVVFSVTKDRFVYAGTSDDSCTCCGEQNTEGLLAAELDHAYAEEDVTVTSKEFSMHSENDGELECELTFKFTVND